LHGLAGVVLTAHEAGIDTSSPSSPRPPPRSSKCSPLWWTRRSILSSST